MGEAVAEGMEPVEARAGTRGRRSRRRRALAAAAWLAAAVLAAWPKGAPAGPESGPWALPPPGSCAPSGGLRGWPIGQDAPPIPFHTGDVVDLGKAEVLKNYLPPALWDQRDHFFYEGQRLEIGPCFRDYAPPAFFQEATEKERGKTRLQDNGGIADYNAGLPFTPDTIAPDDPQAGLKWAWNVAERYQVGGFKAKFRVSDMVGRSGRAEPFEGELFLLQLAGRTDRAAAAYKVPGAGTQAWVSGGMMTEPFAAREYAWRQYRDTATLTDPDRSDDLHAFLPEWRRVRRINSNQIEGIFMPSFSVGVQPATQLSVGAANAGGAVGGVAIGAGGGGGGAITPKRTGFEGLVLRPLLYDFRLLGLQDVLTPINAVTPSYPEATERNYGPWGLSFASDRWDLRRALVLEGRFKGTRGGDQTARLVLYVDLETLQPLYYLSYDKRGEAIDVGMFVGRWSEDRADYPKWPDDPTRPVRVIDSVGESFANLSEGGSWRRESWTAVSVPPSDSSLPGLLSVDSLTKRR
jgi:hypothetical protein